MKKYETASKVSKAAEVTKYATMAAAVGSFVGKASRKVPVISTVICFASIIVESVANKVATNCIFDDIDLDDDADVPVDESGQEDILNDIADENSFPDDDETEE